MTSPYASEQMRYDAAMESLNNPRQVAQSPINDMVQQQRGFAIESDALQEELRQLDLARKVLKTDSNSGVGWLHGRPTDLPNHGASSLK
jgi:hypothetical protein